LTLSQDIVKFLWSLTASQTHYEERKFWWWWWWNKKENVE